MDNSLSSRQIFRGSAQRSSSVYLRENKETIPIDLLIEILSRLPAKSLSKFRCVSKQWSSLLRSPAFTESFSINSSTRQRLLFMLESGGKWHFFSCPHALKGTSVVVADYHMCFNGDPQTNIILSVCGVGYPTKRHMLLNRNIVRVHLICNPSTGQSLVLPKVRARNIDLRSFLGYDPAGKQFKVLCMTVSRYRTQTNSREHQVLTLGDGKPTWRKIECLSPHYPDDESNWICIDGVLYYKARSNMRIFIACFNIRTEKFSFINLEEGSGFSSVLTLINYKGKLGLVVYGYGVGDEIWVLDDIVKEKWSKHSFVLSNTVFNNPKSIWATNKGEIVWATSRLTPSTPFYVYYYNLEMQSMRRVEIKGIYPKLLVGQERSVTIFTFANYVENVMFI